MSLTITAAGPTRSNKRMTLRFGQQIRVGSSPLADFCVLGDEALSGEHFVVRYDNEAIVTPLSEAAPLVVDGHEVDAVSLSQSGCDSRAFIAGNTRFDVSVLTGRREPPAALPAPEHANVERMDRADDIDRLNDVDLLNDVAKPMKLSPEAVELIAQADNAAQFIMRLSDAGLMNDAVRAATRLLPPPAAVRWALEVVGEDEREEKGAGSNVVITNGELARSIDQWLGQPDEDHRRGVQQIMERSELVGIERFVAEAIRRSGGSMAPDGQPIVAPPKSLPALAISTAVSLAIASTTGGPSQIDPRHIAAALVALEPSSDTKGTP